MRIKKIIIIKSKIKKLTNLIKKITMWIRIYGLLNFTLNLMMFV